VGRANHSREGFAHIEVERAIDYLHINLLGRGDGVEFAVLLGFINQEGREILRFDCPHHRIVGLNVLAGRSGGARRDIILLKPVGRQRQTLKVGLRLQHLKQLLLILIRQTTRIRHLFCLSARQSCRALKLNEYAELGMGTSYNHERGGFDTTQAIENAGHEGVQPHLPGEALVLCGVWVWFDLQRDQQIHAPTHGAPY
jgi:hypothetical protein